MRSASEIIAPHHSGFASCKDTLMLVHVTYLVLHDKAGAPDSDNTHPDLYGIRTHQRQHIGTRDFLDQQAIVRGERASLNAWVMRRVWDDAFYFFICPT